MTILMLLTAFFLISNLQGQTGFKFVIKGSVVDKENDSPLEGASIYFAETTIGAMAEKNGHYLLEVRKPGNYELIVSMIGYEIQKKDFSIDKEGEITLNFKMVSKEMNMKAVEVEGQEQDEWKRGLEIFTRKFLGMLQPLSECVIENKEYIDFKWKGDTLVASAKQPIVIINYYLGYKIICEIVKYKFDPVSTYQEYSIFSRFIDLSEQNPDKVEKWKGNRKSFYYGSPAHFLWSLKHDCLAKEGYKVYKAVAPQSGNFNESNEVKSWLDIQYANQYLDEPMLSFTNYLKIEYSMHSEVSYVKLRVPFFTIDNYGIADQHLPFLCYGDWAKIGVGSMLPRDYLPETDKK